MTPELTKWLLEGDPAIRWQTLRDLKGGVDRTVRREQQRVAGEISVRGGRRANYGLSYLNICCEIRHFRIKLKW